MSRKQAFGQAGSRTSLNETNTAANIVAQAVEYDFFDHAVPHSRRYAHQTVAVAGSTPGQRPLCSGCDDSCRL